ncbi:Two-component system sensor histidine kinase [Candidatus Syntrophocurvum alkaliphilum]|uniref:Two-component system sensor histidine kinase n=1 Tax=Candidatus Syntrophocurvum alkaliphilum TaxID=2293317 RepID=A0A6I6DJJ9_9FIRM|nr:sigma 54-interacting transcriptional regulator [Candidatus Syntrophocurvum alkaliphilum]QGU00273.1 Two-component system sensor histidine kinase [Candidatus Syntrophocurvum alkaliphilum]
MNIYVGCWAGENMNYLVDVIGIKEENCTNCHQCISVCPIKICSDGSGDVIRFNNNLCIGCGRCIEVCIRSQEGHAEKSARLPIDDVAQFTATLKNKEEVIALVAPSAQSNFNLNKLITALKKLGINKVYDVALGAEIAIACYHKAIKNNEVKFPIIAQPCPAVVKYIELQHPRLIEHLAPIGSPVYNLSVYVKALHPEAKLAFISPCLAKRREFDDSKTVDYNVTYQSLDRIFKDNNINIETLDDGKFDSVAQAGVTTKFSTPGGLKESYLYHYPDTPASAITKVEGPIVFEKYLSDLEKLIIKGSNNVPLIVDALGCEKGCNMGVGCINHDKSIDEIEHAVALRSEMGTKDNKSKQELQEFLTNVINKYDFSYQHYHDLSNCNKMKLPSENELESIYKKMHKQKEEKKDFRNCAACGYNSCYQMAVAIFNGLNKAENCHLYQEKELRIEQDILFKLHNELTNVFDTISDGIIVLDNEGKITRYNPAAKKVIGCLAEDLLGSHVGDKASMISNLLETGKEFYDVEILIDSKASKIHVTGSGKPILDINKNIIGATLIIRPMTQVQKLVNRFTGAQANFNFNSIIGEHEKIKKSIEIAKVASTNMSNVLLQAESGAGKEVFAQAIHNASPRSNGPFVAVNCAALPRELVGSELFGYVEGAFTGAKRGGRPGKFELANKGTLLLDEIGDMPLEKQAILLRAIQEKAITRVGGDNLINIDVRIIAATNQNLLKLIEQGRFRADLYYRLNVIQINIPSLRERSSDIKILFNHFLQEMAPKFNRTIRHIDHEVIEKIEEYNWPGNIRQLQNVVERTLLVANDGVITLGHLPKEIFTIKELENENNNSSEFTLDNSESLSSRKARKLVAFEQEKEKIINTLNLNAGNVSKTATELGVSRTTLYRKMKEFNIRN